MQRAPQKQGKQALCCFFSCRVVMRFGGVASVCFLNFFFLQLYHSSLFCYLRCFVFLFMVFVSFAVSIHLCVIVSFFCCLTSLTSLFVWPRNRSNHREPRFVFPMFCFFLTTSMLVTHNNLALSNWKQRRNEWEKKNKQKQMKNSQICVTLWSTSSGTGFVLWSKFPTFLLLMIYPPVLFCLLFITVFSSLCFPSTFELSLLFLTWVDWFNITWFSEIENNENTKQAKNQKCKDKTELNFGKNCCLWGYFFGFWLTSCLCLLCCLFFFWGRVRR